MKLRALLLAASPLMLAGCMNLATKPSEITGSYASDLKYENYQCSQLAAEVNSLARREDQLAIAQEQRRKTSKVQAFWAGYGHGDGIEASELANVRGEKEAVRRAMDKRGCHDPAMRVNASTSSAPTPTPVPRSPTSNTPHNASQASWWSSQRPHPASAEPPLTKAMYKCPRADGSWVVTSQPAEGCLVLE